MNKLSENFKGAAVELTPQDSKINSPSSSRGPSVGKGGHAK